MLFEVNLGMRFSSFWIPLHLKKIANPNELVPNLSRKENFQSRPYSPQSSVQSDTCIPFYPNKNGNKKMESCQPMQMHEATVDNSTYYILLRIINLFLSCKMNTKSRNGKSNRYDDWICLLCQNHNYSFRLSCNRCHLQTKEQNAYMNQIYQQHLDMMQEQHELEHTQAHESFPNVLLLVINDDPWEEYPQRREPSETLNVKWINNLIEE